MDLALLVIAAKVFLGKEGTPPDTIPARPNCGVGREAIWNSSTKKWDCVIQFD